MLRVPKRERENDGFRLGVQDFPFWARSRIARSLGFRVSTFGCEATTYCARLRVAVVVARTTLSDSRCYGYVLSLPRAIFISYTHEKSVTELCEVKASRKKLFADYLYSAIIKRQLPLKFTFPLCYCYTDISGLSTDMKYNKIFINFYVS